MFQWEYALRGQDDLLSDEVVIDYHKRRPVSDVINKIPVINKVYKGDSSTGCCQMFAATTINAMNYAIDIGAYADKRYDVQSHNDIYIVWNKLKSVEFSIEKCALVLLHAAKQIGMTVSLTNNYNYNKDQITKILARYNGIGDDAKLYGESKYKLYEIFEAENVKGRK